LGACAPGASVEPPLKQQLSNGDCLELICAVRTLRPVFSSVTNLPSAEQSPMLVGPLALRW